MRTLSALFFVSGVAIANPAHVLSVHVLSGFFGGHTPAFVAAMQFNWLNIFEAFRLALGG